MVKAITLSLAALAATAMGVAIHGMRSARAESPNSAYANCSTASDGICCPQCGCREGLVPVCHQYWTVKKETTYCYKCICEEICVPGPRGGCNTGFLGQFGCKKDCGATSCDSAAGGNGCPTDCGCDCSCHCMHREVHHLVKCPVTKETCVRKCKIEWVCPHCGCGCGCSGEMDVPAGTPSNEHPTPPMPPRQADVRMSGGSS
jgi:hypothetical protein